MRLPKKRLDGSTDAAEWNCMVDCLKSLMQTTNAIRTPHGTIGSARAMQAVARAAEAAGGYAGDYDNTKDYKTGTITRRLNGTPSGVFGALKDVPAGDADGIQVPGVGADDQGDTEYWHFLTGTYGIEEYNALLTYGEGRMVRVSSGDSQGTWMVAKGKTAAAGTVPTWPEPADPTWLLIAFGVRAVQDCPDRDTTIYLNGSPVNDDPPV